MPRIWHATSHGKPRYVPRAITSTDPVPPKAFDGKRGGAVKMFATEILAADYSIYVGKPPNCRALYATT